MPETGCVKFVERIRDVTETYLWSLTEEQLNATLGAPRGLGRRTAEPCFYPIGKLLLAEIDSSKKLPRKPNSKQVYLCRVFDWENDGVGDEAFCVSYPANA
jgi:hypothetical protein